MQEEPSAVLVPVEGMGPEAAPKTKAAPASKSGLQQESAALVALEKEGQVVPTAAAPAMYEGILSLPFEMRADAPQRCSKCFEAPS